MKDMQGTLRVRAVTVDEQPALLVDLPNGASFALGREEMLAFCFTALRILRGMFATPEELNAAVIAAQQPRQAAARGRPCMSAPCPMRACARAWNTLTGRDACGLRRRRTRWKPHCRPGIRRP